MRSSRSIFRASALLAPVLAATVVAQVASGPAKTAGYAKNQRAYYLEQGRASYLRPGVVVKVVSAAIAKDGTITARVSLTDPKGIPLDKDGVNSPGTVSMSFICAYIPAGQKEYVSYSTTLAKATLNDNPSQVQAANDSGGTIAKNADGDYTYTFKTKASTGFDTTATHSIGVSAQRNLSEFMTYDEWSETSNDVYSFVPDGSAVKTTRAVVSTEACNQCHDPLIGHGGSRLKVELCIMCHTPQTVNPDTGLTQDMPVLIHKIHMGKNLPSVKAGTPYRIWHRGQWSDFSDVGFPSGTDELMTCEVCHQGAPQAKNYLTAPSRAACGACHDNVDFASGTGHTSANMPQADDKQCATCHVADSGREFDASIKGAHTVATRSQQLPGNVFSILGVDNARPGQKPVVRFSVMDKSGNPVDISQMGLLNLVLAGPTTDYNGYVSEDVRKATGNGGQFSYTFSAALPATAKGSYAVGIEGYSNVTINPNTTKSQVVRDIGFNQVSYFSLDGSDPAPRRTVVTQDTCQGCHNTLMLHGGIRQSVEYCVVCHNPMVTDSGMRAATDKPESIDFKTMIHKIHTGSNLTTQFTVMGHGNSVNNYNGVGYPGDRRDCAKCHVSGSNELPLPAGLINSVAPRDYMNPMPPISGACLSCHTTLPTAAHASVQISTTMGESCEACHGSASDASVDKVHAR